MTDCPDRASCRSPSKVETVVTCVVRADGMTLIESPGRTVPLVMSPEKPRKSRFGRLTHCTGMRNGCSSSFCSMATSSRCLSSVGPEYHGVRVEALMMLSPLRADTGTHVMSLSPIRASEGAVVRLDRREDGLVIVDEVQLVHRNHNVFYAE